MSLHKPHRQPKQQSLMIMTVILQTFFLTEAFIFELLWWSACCQIPAVNVCFTGVFATAAAGTVKVAMCH